MVLEEFLNTVLLDQAINTRNINVVAVLEKYLVLIKKNNRVTFLYIVGFLSAHN